MVFHLALETFNPIAIHLEKRPVEFLLNSLDTYRILTIKLIVIDF